jgi:hypothetical protein
VATPNRDLEPVVHYRVGGVERPWDEEARLVLLSAFRADKAYAAATPPEDKIRVTPRQRHPEPASKLKTWNGNVELSGTRDGVPTTLLIRVSNVRYDEATGDVFFEHGATLDVEETIGGEIRKFHRDAGQLVFSGAFGDMEVSSWLARILHEQTKLPMRVATMMGRE